MYRGYWDKIDYMIFIISALLFSLMFCLPMMLPKGSILRYYSCYVSFASATLMTTLFLYPLQILLPSVAYRFPEIATELVSKVLGIEWEIRNKTIPEKYKNAIIVVNHQSAIDLLATVMAFRPMTKYILVMKKELEHVFPLGQTMKLFNAAFVDRKNNLQHFKALLKENSKEQDKCLVIYPEGTRNQYGEPFLPFKKGAFIIAVESKRPIIPAVISPYYFIKGRKFTGGKVIISFLEPIETSDLNEGGINDLIERTREVMEKEYKKLKKEVMEEKQSTKQDR